MADALSIHAADGTTEHRLGHRFDRHCQQTGHLGEAVVAATKEDDTRHGGAREREQSGEIGISRDKDPLLTESDGHQFRVGRHPQSARRGMHSFMPAFPKPGCQARRNRHVEKESHQSNSMVPSSASAAA